MLNEGKNLIIIKGENDFGADSDKLLFMKKQLQIPLPQIKYQ